MEKHSVADPVSLGSGREITIKELAGLILAIAGHTPKIVFDPSKPVGRDQAVDRHEQGPRETRVRP